MPEVVNETVVPGSLDAVWEAAKDIEGLSAFIDNLESIEVLERAETDAGLETVSRWVALLPEFGRKVRWTERDVWSTTDRVCTFVQTEGDYDRYEGTWTFVEQDDGVKVTLTIGYDYDVPLIGPLIRALVLRKMQDSVDATQAGLKRRVAGGEVA